MTPNSLIFWNVLQYFIEEHSLHDNYNYIVYDFMIEMRNRFPEPVNFEQAFEIFETEAKLERTKVTKNDVRLCLIALVSWEMLAMTTFQGKRKLPEEDNINYDKMWFWLIPWWKEETEKTGVIKSKIICPEASP